MPALRTNQMPQSGLPTLGWTCVAIKASVNLQFICMACNAVHNGPYHLMRHGSYRGIVRINPVCSTNMQRTSVVGQASRWELGRAAQRTHWLSRAWKRTADGESILTSRDFCITVRLTRQSWGFSVRLKKTAHPALERDGFRSPDDAKLAAFDEITAHMRGLTGER